MKHLQTDTASELDDILAILQDILGTAADHTPAELIAPVVDNLVESVACVSQHMDDGSVPIDTCTQLSGTRKTVKKGHSNMNDSLQLADTRHVDDAAESLKMARIAADHSYCKDPRYLTRLSTSTFVGRGSPPKAAKWQGGCTGKGSASAKSSRPDPEDLEIQQGSEDKGDFPGIPDLAEVQENLTIQVAAHLPWVQMNHMKTLQDLRDDLKFDLEFQTLDGEVDLKFLNSNLTPEQEVKKEDVHWDWGHLFPDVSSEELIEWDGEWEVESEEQAV